jgi:peptidoglycan hydrolase CwlO-like protein
MDVEKTIEFIVAQQAQFHANLEAQQARFEAWHEKFGADLARLEAQQQKQQGQIDSLVILAGRQFELSKVQGERLDRLVDKVDKLGDKVDKLGDKVDKLHEDVSLLFKIVDDLVRRGNGSRPV